MVPCRSQPPVASSCIIKLPPYFAFSVFLLLVFQTFYNNLFPISLCDSPCFLFSTSFLHLCLYSPYSASFFPFLSSIPFDQMPCCYAVSRQYDVSGPSSRHHCFTMCLRQRRDFVLLVPFVTL